MYFLDSNRKFIDEFKNNGQGILERCKTDNSIVIINEIILWMTSYS